MTIREGASVQEISMIVQPMLLHMHPDTNKFEECAPGINQDLPLGFHKAMYHCYGQGDPQQVLAQVVSDQLELNSAWPEAIHQGWATTLFTILFVMVSVC